MQISLKLSADEIKYIERRTLLTRAVTWKSLEKSQLFAFTILADIGIKIDKKAKLVNENFETSSRRKYKIRLKYHEAIILEQYIAGFIDTEPDDYNANLVRTILAQINQKLA